MRRLIPLVLVLVFVGCGKKDLDRETASKFLQGKTFGSVEGMFGMPPPIHFLTCFECLSDSDKNKSPQLTQLQQTGLLSCPDAYTCKPGPKGGALSDDPVRGYVYFAGIFQFAEVVRIQQPTPTTAIAQVAVKFNPSPFYTQYKEILDGLQPQLAQDTAPHLVDVQFTLFDDGWRPQ
jgi:hypothetical protein